MRNQRTITITAWIQRMVLCAVGLLPLAACQEEIHSAQWYMGHGSELQAKLEECKKYPSLNTSDQNCKNASEAWVTLVAATQKKNEAEVPPQPAPPPDPR
jgi:hypothetical protein